jgi:germacradienol/geosmin synthase
LENAAIDYAMLINDVFSYQKEIEYEGEVHNAILVVQNFFGCDYPTGLGVIHDLMTQRMQQFQHVAAHELPVLYEDFKLSPEVRGIMDGYVVQLENWLSGILKWHQDCHRYGAEDLARRAHGFLPDRAPTVPFPGTGAGTVPVPVPVPALSPQDMAETESPPDLTRRTAAGATSSFTLPKGVGAAAEFSLPKAEAASAPH